MSASKLHELTARGQSIWLDNLRRDLISSGELQRLIVEDAVTGVTSNPTILAAAIVGSMDYEAQVASLARRGASVDELYMSLVEDDIRAACDVLRPVWERTRGADGFVSVEVSPGLAEDADATIAEARDWVKRIDRDNLLVKVPANDAGLAAIERLTAEGVSVNVTLIFSLERYREVALAYVSGLAKFVAAGGDASKVVSFASFFVSRMDAEVDKRLDRLSADATAESRFLIAELRGRAGIANARVAYDTFRRTFSGDRWSKLALQGGRVQKPLWASTGVKDPSYPDTMYVEGLLAPSTVNTLPEATIRAFQGHGDPTATPINLHAVREAKRVLRLLEELGVDMNDVTSKLERQGVEKFVNSFTELRQRLGQARAASLAGSDDRVGDRTKSGDAGPTAHNHVVSGPKEELQTISRA
jgi:transaldolase